MMNRLQYDKDMIAHIESMVNTLQIEMDNLRAEIAELEKEMRVSK